MEETAVKVCLRVRPLIDIEKNCGKCLQYPAQNEISVGADKSFSFDYVYDDSRKQHEIYEDCVSPVVKNFLHGYNTTILAYGQTGSGKTYTMGTSGKQEGMNSKDLGIIPRVVTELFSSVKEEQKNNKEYEVRVCFLEIHNEQIKDLLNPTSSENVRTLAIREAIGGEISVSGAEELVVTSAEDMFRALEQGSQNRATGSTNMNHTSSRSHAVFTITLAQKKKQSINRGNKNSSSSVSSSTGSPFIPESLNDSLPLSPINEMKTFDNNDNNNNSNEEEDEEEEITSKFHFVDLAGSERLKRTGATGERMKEGISINCGLLALANVISALSEPKKGGHVPFRDSKITRLLQDSLGGNSQTLMIACVSPADVNAEETLNTLRYASRARNIKNKPVINRNPHTQKILRLTARIVELEALLALQGANVPPAGLKSALNSTTVSLAEYKLLQDQVDVYSREASRLDSKLIENRLALKVSNEALLEAQARRDELELLLSKYSSSISMKADGNEITALTSLKEVRAELNESNQALHKTRTEILIKQNLIDLFEKTYGKADSAMLAQAEQQARKQLLCSNVAASSSSSSSSSSLAAEIEDEQEARQLSQLSEIKVREFDMKMEQLNRVVSSLDSGIKHREHQLKELTRERNENLNVEKSVMVKIDQVEKELQDLNKQKEEQAKSSSSFTSEQQQSLVVKYSKKIDELNAQLRQYREKLKECSSLKAKIEQDEKRILALETEIEASKKQKVKLQQQIKEKSDSYNQWMKEKDQKLLTFAKAALKQQRLMNKLQSENEKQAVLLKRKDEQTAILHNKYADEKEKNAKNFATMNHLLQQKHAGAAAPTTTSTIKRALATQTLNSQPKKTALTSSTTLLASTTSVSTSNIGSSRPTSLKPNLSLTSRPKFGSNVSSKLVTASLLKTGNNIKKDSVFIEKDFPGKQENATVNKESIDKENVTAADKENVSKEGADEENAKLNDFDAENMIDAAEFFSNKENVSMPSTEQEKPKGRKALTSLCVNTPLKQTERSIVEKPVERRRSGRLSEQPPPYDSSDYPNVTISLPNATIFPPNVTISPPNHQSPPNTRSSARKRKNSTDLFFSPLKIPQKKDASTVDISQSIQEMEAELLRCLNTANKKELQKIPSIGRVRAEKIITARSEKPFTQLSDLSSIGLKGNTIVEITKRQMIGRIWHEKDINLLRNVA